MEYTKYLKGKNLKMQTLTCMVQGLKENISIGRNGLSFDKVVVDPELSTTLIVHLDHQTFASMMSKIQHRPYVEVRREQMH